MRFGHILHYSHIMLLKYAQKTGFRGDFLYFTKLSTDYVHSTNRAENLIMALKCRVCRELVCKNAALGTLLAPRAALLQTRLLQTSHTHGHTYIFLHC